VHIVLGEGFVEVKIEADSSDITEHPHCDQPSISMFGLFDVLFSAIIFCTFFFFIWCGLCFACNL